MAGRCGCDSAPATGAAATGSNCHSVTGAGTPGSPFAHAPIISPAVDNQLSCTASGLYVSPSPSDIEVTGVGDAVEAGPPPAVGSGGWRLAAGTFVGTTNVAGHLGVSYPGGSFVNGVVTVVATIGDVPLTLSNMSIDAGSYTLTAFDAVFQDDAGVAISGGTYRVNWIALGW